MSWLAFKCQTDVQLASREMTVKRAVFLLLLHPRRTYVSCEYNRCLVSGRSYVRKWPDQAIKTYVMCTRTMQKEKRILCHSSVPLLLYGRFVHGTGLVFMRLSMDREITSSCTYVHAAIRVHHKLAAALNIYLYVHKRVREEKRLTQSVVWSMYRKMTRRDFCTRTYT